MSYLAGTIIAVAAGLILVAVIYVQYELHRPAPRPRLVYPAIAARRVRRAPRARWAAPGASCACGGTVGRTGQVSARFGDLLGCTGCARTWTMDGRRILRHRPRSLPGGGHDGRREADVRAVAGVRTAGDGEGEGPW